MLLKFPSFLPDSSPRKGRGVSAALRSQPGGLAPPLLQPCLRLLRLRLKQTLNVLVDEYCLHHLKGPEVYQELFVLLLELHTLCFKNKNSYGR